MTIPGTVRTRAVNLEGNGAPSTGLGRMGEYTSS